MTPTARGAGPARSPRSDRWATARRRWPAYRRRSRTCTPPRACDDVRVAGLRRPRPGGVGQRHALDRGRRAWPASARPARRSSARPATPSRTVGHPPSRRGTHPHGGRFLRGSGGSRRRRAGARGARAPTAGARSGSRPRAADWSGSSRPAGRISGFPMYGDPVGLATLRPDRAHGARCGRPARRAGRPAGGRSLLGATRLLGRSCRPAPRSRAACGSLASSSPSSPTSRSTRGPDRLRAGDPAARPSLGHAVETRTVPIPPEAVPVFETCWAVLTALSIAPLPAEKPALLRPLTRWLGERGESVSGPEFGLAIGAAAAVRRRGAGRPGAVRHRAHAHPRHPAAACRAIRERRRPGGRLRGPEALHAVDQRLERHRHAGDLAAAPLGGQPTAVLPVGVMLAARPAEEELLLSLSAQLEAAAPWSDRRPPGW